MMESKSISLNEVKESALKWLKLKDSNIIDVALAVTIANKLPSDPLWMFLTGPPSSAKTEILNGIAGYENVEMISSLTPATLISGKTIKGKGNMSLLPKLTDKMLVIKDFGTILTLHREARGEILAQLREVYDGRIDKAFGTGERVTWEGKLGIIAGVTPAIDKYISVNAMLGERFLHYRTGEGEQYSAGCCAFDSVFSEEKNRLDFRDKVRRFLDKFDRKLDVDLDEGDVRERIVALAVFCAHARSAIYRNRYDRTLEAMPQAEGPARLSKQLKLLAISLALVRSLDTIDAGVYEVVKKTARDTLPRLRFEVLKTLWELCEGRDGWHSTKEIAMAADMPTTTVKLKLENMNLLGLVNRDREGEAETAPYIWKPSKLMESLVRVSEIFSY